MGFITLQELQSAPLALQMPVLAVAYIGRLNPQGIISLVCIFMLRLFDHNALCYLRIGTIFFSEERKIYSLFQWDAQSEETHYAKRGQTEKKWYLCYFV